MARCSVTINHKGNTISSRVMVIQYNIQYNIAYAIPMVESRNITPENNEACQLNLAYGK